MALMANEQSLLARAHPPSHELFPHDSRLTGTAGRNGLSWRVLRRRVARVAPRGAQRAPNTPPK
jgi:hypothetical protein